MRQTHRRFVLSRFPYSIIYEIIENREINVVAIMHNHRKQGYWCVLFTCHIQINYGRPTSWAGTRKQRTLHIEALCVTKNNRGKMRRIIFLACAIALSACNSTPDGKSNEIQPIDFVGNKKSLKKMWIVSKNDYPKYPIDAAWKGISGCVDFSFVISSEGKAQNIQVIKAIPDSTFIRSATKSLKNFRWQPTELNDERQPAVTTLQLDFSTTPVMKVAECIVGDT